MKLPFFKFDAAAWLTGKVQLLTPSEKGIFIDLLARIWHENGTLRHTEFLHRQIRCEKIELSNALKTFAELSIMEENDGVLSVKFIGEQLSENNAYREVRRACGAKGGRPKKVEKDTVLQEKVEKDTALHEKADERSEKKETKEKSGKKENTEKKETSPSGEGDKAGADAPAREEVTAPTPTFSPEHYPQSVEEVMAIAEDPRCAVKITREQAEKYFLTRDTADWVDASAARRRISPGKIYGDLRKWVLDDQARRKPGAAAPEPPPLKLPDSAFEPTE